MKPGRRSKKRKSKANRVKRDGKPFKSKFAFVTAQTARKIFQFASLIKSVPFEVLPDRSDRLRVRLFQKWWQRWLWYVPNVVLYSCAIFQAVSFPRVVITQGLSTESALHIAYVVMYMLGVLYFVPMLADSSTYVDLINGVDSLMEQCKDWSEARWNHAPFAVFTINYFVVALASVLPMILGMYFLMPTHSRYLISILPPDLQSVSVLVGGAVLETVVFIWIATLLLVYYCYWCMIVFQKLLWLEELCNLADMADYNADRWSSLIELYRSLKCLNILHNSFHRHFSTGFNIVISITEILFLYCSLVAFDLVPTLLYMMFPAFSFFIMVLIIALFPYIARWEQRSGDFVALSMAKLKPLRERNQVYDELYKEVRALSPLCNELSHFTTTSFETSLAMSEQIIDNLVLLLTL